MPRPQNPPRKPLDEDNNPKVGLSSCRHCNGILGPTQKYGYCRECKLPIHMTLACIKCTRTGQTVPDQKGDTPEDNEPIDRPPARKQPEFRFELEGPDQD